MVVGYITKRCTHQHQQTIAVGMIFRLREQKLVKNNQDNQIQNITLCNMYFRKRRYIHVYNGVRGKAPRSWGVFEHFYVKSNLTVCKVTFNCKLNEKMGEQDVLQVCSPSNFVGAAPMQHMVTHHCTNRAWHRGTSLIK